TGMAYDLAEHRHRFSVWAAARAAQRGLKGGKVDVLRKALEQSGVMAFAKANDTPIDQAAFDQAHRAWCRSIIAYLASKNVPATFGRLPNSLRSTSRAWSSSAATLRSARALSSTLPSTAFY